MKNKSQKTRWRRWLLWLTVITLLAVVVAASVVEGFGWWLRLGYDPRHYHMKTALPIIQALDKYHSDKGKYPDKSSDLAQYLPTNIVAMETPGGPSGFGLYGPREGITWYYSHGGRSSNGYELRAQLRDNSCSYEFDGTNGTWWGTYNDGDIDQKIPFNP